MILWAIYYYYPETYPANLRYIAYINADNADDASDECVKLHGKNIIISYIEKVR